KWARPSDRRWQPRDRRQRCACCRRGRKRSHISHANCASFPSIPGGAMLRKTILVFACAFVLPRVVWAQASLAGVVRDESGGVLPGVTVEAASPALIEAVRTATTDEQGRYRIESLRPGPSKGTFSRSG